MRTLSFSFASTSAFAVAAATFLAASPALAQFDEAPPEEPKRPAMVLLPRVGFLLDGTTKETVDCKGAPCSESRTYGNGGLALGLDLLGEVTPGLRLGLATLFVPDASIEVDGTQSSIGSDLSAQAVVEGVFGVAPKLTLHVRGQAGVFKLFPGGAMDDFASDKRRECSRLMDAGTLTSCRIDQTSPAAFVYGLGVGTAYAVSKKTALRLDLHVESFSVKFLERSAEGPGVSGSSTNRMDTTRIWALFGVELGLF